jgi:hypothetical protein
MFARDHQQAWRLAGNVQACLLIAHRLAGQRPE